MLSEHFFFQISFSFDEHTNCPINFSSNIINIIFPVYIFTNDNSYKFCIIYLTYCLIVDKKFDGSMTLLILWKNKEIYFFYIEGQFVNLEPQWDTFRFFI